MRRIVDVSNFLLVAVLLAACASATPPSRLGDYVSSDHRANDEAFSRIEQRPLKAGLVLVSDTAEPGAAPNLPDEAHGPSERNVEAGHCSGDTCHHHPGSTGRSDPSTAERRLDAICGVRQAARAWSIWSLWCCPAPNRNIR